MTRKKTASPSLRSKLLKSQKAKILDKKKKKLKRKQIKKKGYTSSNNKSKYKQGKFWSKKNQKEYVFRSAYELAYFHVLEEDEKVISYIVEPCQVSYRFNGAQRKYWPDLLVLYKDGSMKILEVKPEALVGTKQNQAKAAGCRLFIKSRLKNTTYEFVTEKDIFHSDKDYKQFVKMIK